MNELKLVYQRVFNPTRSKGRGAVEIPEDDFMKNFAPGRQYLVKFYQYSNYNPKRHNMSKSIKGTTWQEYCENFIQEKFLPGVNKFVK